MAAGAAVVGDVRLYDDVSIWYGCILRADITDPSNWRAAQHLDEWLKSMDLVGIAGIDTRRLTRRIREGEFTFG